MTFLTGIGDDEEELFSMRDGWLGFAPI